MTKNHPEPQDAPILTKTDKSVAMIVWAVGPLISILIVSMIALYFS